MAKSIREYMTEAGVNQEQLSEHTGVHQSQISRFRRGKFRRWSPNLETICDYAKIDLSGEEFGYTTKIENTELLNAIGEVWDRTERNAKVLAKIIRSLKGLR